MSTVFTMIINGDIPGTFVWRDEHCVAFMSINPITAGHVLVVPVEEIDHWIDASPELNAHMFDVSRTIAQAQERAFGCERVGMIIAGYEVPHAHIHLIPTNEMSELSFAHAASSVERSDLDAWAAAIAAELST